MDPIALSVIVPTTARHASLSKLLQSLINQKTCIQFEVLVISNLDSRKVEKIINNFQSEKIKYHFAGKLGVNRARNKGLSLSQGKILYFLDDDCVLDAPDTIQRVYDFHQENPDIFGFGGGYKASATANTADKTYHQVAKDWLTQSRMTAEKTTQLIGGNMSFKKSLWPQDVQFNEEIIFGGSEAEFNLKAFSLGLHLYYDPSFAVLHETELSYFKLIKKAFLQGYGQRFQANYPIPFSVYSQVLTNKLDNKFFMKSYRSAFTAGQMSDTPRFGKLRIFLSMIFYWKYKKTNLLQEIERTLRLNLFLKDK